MLIKLVANCVTGSCRVIDDTYNCETAAVLATNTDYNTHSFGLIEMDLVYVGF